MKSHSTRILIDTLRKAPPSIRPLHSAQVDYCTTHYCTPYSVILRSAFRNSVILRSAFRTTALRYTALRIFALLHSVILHYALRHFVLVHSVDCLAALRLLFLGSACFVRARDLPGHRNHAILLLPHHNTLGKSLIINVLTHSQLVKYSTCI